MSSLMIESDDPRFWRGLIDWLNEYDAIPGVHAVVRVDSDEPLHPEHWNYLALYTLTGGSMKAGSNFKVAGAKVWTDSGRLLSKGVWTIVSRLVNGLIVVKDGKHTSIPCEEPHV